MFNLLIGKCKHDTMRLMTQHRMMAKTKYLQPFLSLVVHGFILNSTLVFLVAHDYMWSYY